MICFPISGFVHEVGMAGIVIAGMSVADRILKPDELAFFASIMPCLTLHGQLVSGEMTTSQQQQQPSFQEVLPLNEANKRSPTRQPPSGRMASPTKHPPAMDSGSSETKPQTELEQKPAMTEQPVSVESHISNEVNLVDKQSGELALTVQQSPPKSNEDRHSEATCESILLLILNFISPCVCGYCLYSTLLFSVQGHGVISP